MSEGTKLISAILSTGSTEYLRKLTPDMFVGNEQQLHQYVVRHFRSYGVLPTLATAREDGGFRLPDTDETVSYYFKRVVDRRIYSLVRPRFQNLRDALADGNVDAVKEVILDLRSVTRSASVDEDVRNLREAVAAVIDGYDVAKYAADGVGVPTGWPGIDDVLGGGYQPADLVTQVARLSVGKTHLLIRQALNAWASGRSVLLVTMEMTVEQIARRAMGQQTGVDLDKFRKAQLSTAAMRRLRSYASSMMNADRFTLYAGAFSKSTDDLDVLVTEIEPDIVFIDGAYILKPPAGSRKGLDRLARVPEVFDALKTQTIVYKKPYVVTSQFSRQAGKKGKDGSIETISFSDAIAQHSSIVMAIKEGKPPFTTTRRTIEILKGREGESGEFQVNFLFSPTNFDEVTEEEAAASDVGLDWMG